MPLSEWAWSNLYICLSHCTETVVATVIVWCFFIYIYMLSLSD